MGKEVVRGYMASNKDKGLVTICVSWPESPTKRYLHCDLQEALDVLTRGSFVRLKEWTRKP